MLGTIALYQHASTIGPLNIMSILHFPDHTVRPSASAEALPVRLKPLVSVAGRQAMNRIGPGFPDR